jgi:hypothetical protein
MESQATAETGTCFGTLRNKAIALLMLHWLYLDDRDSGNQGVGGTVKREREGMLEKEYMIDFSLTSRYPDLSQTRWGMELIRLRKQCLMLPRNRFTPSCGS